MLHLFLYQRTYCVSFVVFFFFYCDDRVNFSRRLDERRGRADVCDFHRWNWTRDWDATGYLRRGTDVSVISLKCAFPLRHQHNAVYPIFSNLFCNPDPSFSLDHLWTIFIHSTSSLKYKICSREISSARNWRTFVISWRAPSFCRSVSILPKVTRVSKNTLYVNLWNFYGKL